MAEVHELLNIAAVVAESRQESLYQTRHYLKDHLGSTRLVIDENGTVKGNYDYFAFGHERGDIPDSAEHYRYTSKPLEAEADLNIYYYGARYYNPELGRFLAMDPAASKYPGWSPYAYTLDNPLKFVDPDGEKVEFAPNQTQQFKQDFAKAINYLNKHGISGTFARLEKLPQTVYVSAAQGKRKTNIYDHSTHTIFGDPQLAAKLTSGRTVSPSSILNHEGAHAEQHLINPNQYFNDLQTPDPQYHDAEEKRVIQNVETPANTKAGEGTRTDHAGTYFRVKDPTNRIKPPPPPPAIMR